MSLGKPEYVSDLVVYLLNRLGVEYVTLKPGATTRGMHESLQNRILKEHPWASRRTCTSREGTSRSRQRSL